MLNNVNRDKKKKPLPQKEVFSFYLKLVSLHPQGKIVKGRLSSN